MNQEELHERRMKGEKVLECVYEIVNGKEEIRRYEKKIEAVWENGFETFGYGYRIPFDDFGRWRMQSCSSNAYEYHIFLTCEENIEDYLPKIKNVIANRLRNEIKNLEESLKLLS